ncbi:hypothetical protein [[Eubacterium] cellulosolvens]
MNVSGSTIYLLVAFSWKRIIWSILASSRALAHHKIIDELSKKVRDIQALE